MTTRTLSRLSALLWLLACGWAEAVLNGSNARYRNCDGALALRNLAEAVKEHPCVLRKGSEIEFAAGLFQE